MYSSIVFALNGVSRCFHTKMLAKYTNHHEWFESRDNKSFTVGLLPLNKTIMLLFAKCRLVPSISGVLRSAIHYSLYFIVPFSNSSHATRAPFWSLLVSAKIVNPSHRKFVFYSKQETESLYLLKIQAFQLTPIFSIESSSVLVFLP